MRKYALYAIALCAPLAITDAKAQEIPAALSGAELAQHRGDIRRVEEYLSSLTTIVAEFIQAAPDGTLTSGKFYLQRPGKMRWQYNPPTPILMVSNGSELVYYDYELEQVSYIPLDSTLIGFLAKDPIRFDDNIDIRAFEKAPGAIRITLAQRKKPKEGQLMLEFSDNPLLLRNMVVTDASNQMTNVALNNARFGVELDPKLFVFTDPRKNTRRIRR